MMRVVALTVAPGPAVIQNSDGDLVSSRVPVFTFEGSLSVVLFPAVVGLFLGLLLFIIRVLWPPISSWRGTLLGAILLAVAGIPLMLNTPELDIGPPGVGTVLFAITPFVYGWTFELLVRSGERVSWGK